MKDTSYYAYPGLQKSTEEIIKLVFKRAEQKFGLSREKMISPSRKGEISHARQVVQYALRVKTRMTYRQIGDIFNGRDHSTAKHSFETIQGLVDVNPEVRDTVNEILTGIF